MTDDLASLRDELLQKLDMRAIAAMARNRIIGKNNTIPWSIPEELRFFRRMTKNAAVLMGRKTFESIGHPLPDRQNIVISSNPHWHSDGVLLIRNLQQLLHANVEKVVWVCGGATIYELLFPACRELYLSTVGGEFVGDTKLPEFDTIFSKDGTILTCEAFVVDHYLNKRFLGKQHAGIEKNPVF
jgi:dihydrofolate reductase